MFIDLSECAKSGEFAKFTHCFILCFIELIGIYWLNCVIKSWLYFQYLTGSNSHKNDRRIVKKSECRDKHQNAGGISTSLYFICQNTFQSRIYTNPLNYLNLSKNFLPWESPLGTNRLFMEKMFKVQNIQSKGFATPFGIHFWDTIRCVC